MGVHSGFFLKAGFGGGGAIGQSSLKWWPYRKRYRHPTPEEEHFFPQDGNKGGGRPFPSRGRWNPPVRVMCGQLDVAVQIH